MIFTLIVEEKPKLELLKLEWHEEQPPDIVILNKLLLVKVGRYLALKDRYRYRVATVAILQNGRLAESK